MVYDLDTKIRDLLANETIKAKMKEWFPNLVDTPTMNMVKGSSLKQAAMMAPGILNKEMLEKIADFLKTVKD